MGKQVLLLATLAAVLLFAGCSGDETETLPPTGTTVTSGTGGTGGGTTCTADEQCNDDIDCTSDSCEGGVCEHNAVDAECDDGDFCNGVEQCDASEGCVAAEVPACDDGIGCTADGCDEATDSCTNTPDNGACDDNLYCTGTEVCDPVDDCVAGTPPCDDGVACTTDCDEQTQNCAVIPNDMACDDGLFCTGAETCDPVNGCISDGDPCDDSATCSTDSCNEQSDSCSHQLNHSACVDTLFCNGSEVCDPANGAPGTGCATGGDPCDDSVGCTLDSCQESSDTCINSPSSASCDDGLYCTGVEFCDAVLDCQTTGQPSCFDAYTCTADFCDLTSDSCMHVPQNNNCNDGQYCNGVETCNPPNGAPGTGCVTGTAPNCNDNVACTVDTCSNTQSACVNTPNHASCSDNVFCNGAEQCVAGLGCQPASAVVCNDGLTCTSDSCNEATDSCSFAPNNTACNDGLYCNGVETCNPNSPAPSTGCNLGTPINCPDDGIACTIEACSESTMSCQTTNNNSVCPPGQFCIPSMNGCVPATPCTSSAQCDDNDDCNGVETCHPTLLICQQGTPVNCDDGVICTVDLCNPNGGTCSNLVNHAFCDDGFACNGTELCDPFQDCVQGTQVTCNDNVACTFDLCVEPNATCLNLAQNSACDDGLFCTGTEICDPQLGCQSSGAPSCADNVACTVDSCEESTQQCAHVPDHSLCGCNQTCDPVQGCGNFCNVTACENKVYQCGDCLDNDNDCLIDSGTDPECWGPCQNNETGFKGNIPGQNNAPCKSDCYFDGDSGSGNDDCYWSHSCDPLSVSPNYPPEGSQCSYNPNASIPGSNMTCSQAQQTQSQACLNICGPLTPNGCDCFGCCFVDSLGYSVWLGSEVNGNGSCSTQTLTNPNLCKPCTQVQGCLNTCETCEICIGKPTLPPECTCQECAPSQTLCGPPCGGSCPFGEFCNSGCCVPAP
jgi:hypothetical protein